MAETTKIEWCDSTWNPWIGCTKVSPGCDNCYAECATPSRTLGVVWGPHAARHRTSPSNWMQPLRWEKKHAEFFAKHGRRQRVFCASLADVFDNQAPAEWRADLFDLIQATPHLDWLLVTKRIGTVPGMVQAVGGMPDNVWLGITVTDQREADRDIPKLLAVPARVRFLSCEPLLGPLDFKKLRDGDPHMRVDALTGWVERGVTFGATYAKEFRPLDWVIVGGESGPKARPMHLPWARDLRNQCAAAGVPFLFKQWGEWLPDGDTAIHVGKKAAGRLLDGVEHTAFPT